MNNHIQLVLKSSTTELSLNDRELGIYVVPQLDGLTGLPEIRTTSGVNSGYDGGWTSAQNYDARSITIRGVIANEDVATVERLRRQLVSLAGQGKNEELTLDLVTEAGNSYTLQVRTIALEMAMQRVLKQQEFMLQLRADDPLIYDNSEQTHEALIQVAKATGGFRIDFALPLAIDGGSEETIVSNEGLEEVPTITRMYGALHNPKIINHTTNQSMQITADLGYAQGEPINPRDAEGSTIAINDAIEAPFNNVQLQGNTEQATYTGKNLLPIRPSGSAGIAVSYDSATGEITVSGTATGTYPHITEQNAITNIIPSGTALTFSTIDFINGASIIHLRLYKADTSGTYADIALSNSVRSKQYTLEYDVNKTMVLIQTTTGNVLSGKIKLQLEKGSATDFEPYVGGAASPSPDYPQAVKTVTGYNEVKIIGKNLFDKNNVNIFNGYIWNTNPTQFKENNTDKAVYIRCEPNTTYTVSKMVSEPVSANRLRLATSSEVPAGGVIVNNKLITDDGTDVRQGTITTGSNDKYLAVACYNGSGTSLQDILDSIQIEKSSQSTPYELYKSYSHEINLGKNFIDTNMFEFGGMSNGSPRPDSDKFRINCANHPIAVRPNTTYTISVSLGSTVKGMRVGVHSARADGTHIADSGWKQLASSSYTFTTTNDTAFVKLILSLSTTSNNVTTGGTENTSITSGTITDWLRGANVQLELGQATDYAPYFNPIELCKLGTYQDYIYKQDGKWLKHSEVGKVVLDGTNYTFRTYYGTKSGKRAFTMDLPNAVRSGDAKEIATICSDKLKASSRERIYNDTDINVFAPAAISSEYYGTGGAIMIEAMKAMNISEANTWLSNNNVVLYYALATPTDTEITYEPLIEQLNNLQWGGTLKGINNISVDSPELEGILDLSYFTDRNPDRRDEIVIDSRLKTITLNGLDIYNLKTEGSEFLTLAPGENKLSLQSDINGDNGYAEISYKQGYLSI